MFVSSISFQEKCTLSIEKQNAVRSYRTSLHIPIVTVDASNVSKSKPYPQLDHNPNYASTQKHMHALPMCQHTQPQVSNSKVKIKIKMKRCKAKAIQLLPDLRNNWQHQEEKAIRLSSYMFLE